MNILNDPDLLFSKWINEQMDQNNVIFVLRSFNRPAAVILRLNWCPEEKTVEALECFSVIMLHHFWSSIVNKFYWLDVLLTSDAKLKLIDHSVLGYIPTLMRCTPKLVYIFENHIPIGIFWHLPLNRLSSPEKLKVLKIANWISRKYVKINTNFGLPVPIFKFDTIFPLKIQFPTTFV